MTDSRDHGKALKASDLATLGLLVALEQDEAVTQRGLSARIGVALGLTNSLIKRAVIKGMVKVHQVPAKRIGYYVTPKGFTEKSRLVAQYLSASLSFFRKAREEYSVVFAQVRAQNRSRIALFGEGELAEIALLSAQADGVTIDAIIHPGSNKDEFAGIPVINNLDLIEAHDFDGIVITASNTPQEAYDLMVLHMGSEHVFAVPLLHVNNDKNRKVPQ